MENHNGIFYYANEVTFSESPGFPKNVRERCESWTVKKAECQRIDASNCVARETPESLLDSKIKPVNSKGNQP